MAATAVPKLSQPDFVRNLLIALAQLQGSPVAAGYQPTRFDLHRGTTSDGLDCGFDLSMVQASWMVITAPGSDKFSLQPLRLDPVSGRCKELRRILWNMQHRREVTWHRHRLYTGRLGDWDIDDGPLSAGTYESEAHLFLGTQDLSYDERLKEDLPLPAFTAQEAAAREVVRQAKAGGLVLR